MPNAKLPEHPSLDYLRKLAKTRLEDLRRNHPDTKLATALLHVARDYGFPSWRALKAQIDSQRSRKMRNPVMRFLAVADVDRSARFYRDVLDFDVREQNGGMEATLGPVRIRFGKEGFEPGDWTFETPRPPGSAILFLECEDVAAKRTALRVRGAVTSGLERVNWIKMQVFEVRDPDGNVLWFGQSYHKGQDSPSRRAEQSRGLRQALPELPFHDVAAAVVYYRDVLGFRINYQQHDLGVMDRDAITVLLIARTAQHQGIGSCEFYVSDADALYDELQGKGAGIQGPPVSRPWGLRDFRIIDLEGNRLTFAQTFE